MRKHVIAVAAMFGLAAACAPEPTLTPAPQAAPAPGAPGGATATVAGVNMSAWPDQWTAEPRDLTTHVAPVLVRLENNSQSNILVRFDHFELTNPRGDNFSAIPPFELDATVTEPITVTGFPLRGFFVAPHLRTYYPELRPFADPFAVDRTFYGRHLTAWRTIDLPTPEMVRLALPEGVLEPGGVVTGYVYFEAVTDEPDQVTLDYNLVTTDEQNLGSVRIPFRVTS